MTAPSSHSVPLSYDNDQQGLRLLELPPELLELFSGPDPPTLQIKSSSSGSTSQPSHIVLCTHSQTYQLRQVQSSNTIFISRPVLAQDVEAGTTDSSICAFAKCSSILELHPQLNDGKIKAKTAKELLQRALRVYNGTDDDFMDESLKGSRKEDLFEDIPYSQQECEQAWRDLVAFERHDACWQASPKVLSDLWDMMVQTTQAEGIHMEEKFDIEDLKSKLDDSSAPEEIMAALLRHLCQLFDLETLSPKLDRVTTVKWIGEITAMTLDALNESVTIAGLLSRWQNRLPEIWRQDATIEAAQELTSKQSQDKGKVNNVNPVCDEAATGTKRPLKGRDWHERFKKLRK